MNVARNERLLSENEGAGRSGESRARRFQHYNIRKARGAEMRIRHHADRRGPKPLNKGLNSISVRNYQR